MNKLHKINWVCIDDRHPKIGAYVLVTDVNDGWPRISTDTLIQGDDSIGRPSSLVFWGSGTSFDDISHWAHIPNLPENHKALAFADESAVSTSKLCDVLGFSVSVSFLKSLGCTPAAEYPQGCLWRTQDFRDICTAIINHVSRL